MDLEAAPAARSGRGSGRRTQLHVAVAQGVGEGRQLFKGEGRRACFHIVSAGRKWLREDGAKEVALQGDVVGTGRGHSPGRTPPALPFCGQTRGTHAAFCDSRLDTIYSTL